MKSTEDGVKEQVAVAIREKLRPKVDQLVAETVARLVQDRVRDEVRTFIGFGGCPWESSRLRRYRCCSCASRCPRS